MSLGRNQISGEFVYKTLTASGTNSFTGLVYPEVNSNAAQIQTNSDGFWITYGFRNQDPTPTKSGVSTLDTTTLLVNIFLDPKVRWGRLEIYAGDIRDLLDGYKSAAPVVSGFYVQSCTFRDIDTGFEDDLGPTGAYFATLEFDIRISKQ